MWQRKGQNEKGKQITDELRERLWRLKSEAPIPRATREMQGASARRVRTVLEKDDG